MPVKVETIRKSWNSETIRYTFAHRTFAILFFWEQDIVPEIGERITLDDNTVTIFTCSAD